ncbi:MAG: Gfo/Idh/MocA family oxidoreductase [candidate division WS1 bacterium]|jgi:predicted dehydrogenase|nr:Gfo/Idh/MocA family oxidoreductase [candidate division WS1 bacterium]
MDTMSRRDFIQRSAGVVAGAAAASSLLAFGRRAMAQDDELRVAVLGINGRGTAHISAFMNLPGCRVAALCDPDETLFASRAEAITDAGHPKPKFYPDIRDVLEDDEIDVLSVATPNHWHCLATIWGCQAGKDVYVEKPLSWGIWEGRQAVKAARKYGRIVQVGTQGRSDGRMREAIARFRRGDVGSPVMARATCFKPRASIGFQPIEEPPPTLHWDIWRGPGPDVPFHRNLVHYNWHWFYDFGNGDLGNQGVHQMDIARWGLGQTLPVRVSSTGGRLGYVDQGETPNTQTCNFQYEDGTMLVFEVRGLPTAEESGGRIGNQFYGSEGWMCQSDGFVAHVGYDGDPREIDGPLPPVGGAGPEDHFANFVRAVRSRRIEDLNADVLEGHYSAALCHMALIAYRLGRDLEFCPEREEFVGDDEANAMLRRPKQRVRRDGVGLVANPFEVPEVV